MNSDSETGSMTRLLRVLAVCLVAASCCGLLLAQATGEEQQAPSAGTAEQEAAATPAPPEGEAAEPLPAPPGAGMLAFLDPVTGELREPTALELKELSDQIQPFEVPSEELVPEPHPLGGQVVHLGDRGQVFVYAVPGADGSMTLEHRQGPAEDAAPDTGEPQEGDRDDS